MIEQENNLNIIILAAGKGTRMKSDLPKVIQELKNQPLIEYVVATIESLSVKPVVVVSEDNIVRDYLGDRVEYVIQAERLGTGHAVMQAEEFLKDKLGGTIVLYGDMPFIKAESIENLVKIHNDNNSQISLMTVRVPNFEGQYKDFYDFGRIIRNEKGEVERIIELKDANEKEKENKELNTSYFCFDNQWLWQNIKKLKNNNVAGEYYLTDLLGIAIEKGDNVTTVEILPEEAVGINTMEHLETLCHSERNVVK